MSFFPTKKQLLLFIFYSLISFIFLLPIFKNLTYWGIQDWDLDIFYHTVPRATILQYKQFPLWNPYYCGGAPLLANPQSKFLTPFFLPILVFGEIIGIKINLWLYCIIGLIGMYYLASSYKASFLAALFSSFIYILNSALSFSIVTGMSTFTLMAFIPWIFYFFKQFLSSKSSKKYLFMSSILLTLMFLSGGVQLFIITLTLLISYSFFTIIFRESLIKKVIKSLLIVIFFAFCLSAVKLFPALELTKSYPRLIKDWSGYSLQALQYSLLDRNQALTSIRKMPWGGNIFFGFNHEIGMEENGLYVGILPLIFFVIGIICCSKNNKVLFFTLVVFLWLIFGARAPLSLWEFSRLIPILNLTRIAQRYRFVFILIFAIFSSFGLQRFTKIISRLFNKKVANILQLGIIAFVFIDLTLVNWRILKDAFTIPPIKIEKKQEFTQIQIMPNYDKFGWRNSDSDMLFRSWSSLYPVFLSNKGTIDCYEPIPFSKNALANDSKQYKGEIFFVGEKGQAAFSSWSPNKIIINVYSSKGGMVVINQNFYPGWKIKNNKNLKVESYNGLIGIKVTPDIKNIELYYLPITFIIGLLITCSTIVFLSVFINKSLVKQNFS